MGESQFLRYGFPGWTLILVILSYWLLTPDFNMGMLTDKNIDLAVPVAFLAAIGVPIGYIIYQVYFALDWFTTHKLYKVSKSILGVNYINGTYKMFGITRQQREIQKLEEAWLNKLLEKNETALQLVKDEFTGMRKMLHSLGASIVSVISGHIISFVFFFGFFKYRYIEDWYQFLFVAFLWFLVFIAALYNRHYTQYNIICYQRKILHS